MTLKQALKRIEELEKRVRELEARPPVHHYYHYRPYLTLPQPTITQPTQPWGPWEITCVSGSVS